MLGYRSLIEHKIIPALGGLRLSRVDTATIDRFLAQLSERGTRCKHCQHLLRIGQAPLRARDRYRPRPGLREREHPTDCLRGLPMSPSAVRDVHAVLAGAFKQAQVWGWIDHNPMTLVTRPAVRHTDAGQTATSSSWWRLRRRVVGGRRASRAGGGGDRDRRDHRHRPAGLPLPRRPVRRAGHQHSARRAAGHGERDHRRFS
jgi:hypothetical protein